MAAPRPGFLPADGTVVSAMTAVGPDSDRDAKRVVGPLQTWWVDSFDIWQVIVAGWAVEPESVQEIVDAEARGAG